MSLLRQALCEAAESDVVLVACDYDGTLAPIVTDPDRAWPDRRALEALVSLAARPGVHAAIVSGRSAVVLKRLSGDPAGIELIGSHGAEPAGRPPEVSMKARRDLARVRSRMAQLCDEYAGSHLEEKPAGVAFHYRNLDPARQSAAAIAARQTAEDFPTLTILEGRRVVEVVGTTVDKGEALQALRDRWRADRVVFIGDDVTDENAFATLRDVDVGVKVGSAPTRAQFRIDDQSQVAAVLESLLACRRVRPH